MLPAGVLLGIMDKDTTFSKLSTSYTPRPEPPPTSVHFDNFFFHVVTAFR